MMRLEIVGGEVPFLWIIVIEGRRGQKRKGFCVISTVGRPNRQKCGWSVRKSTLEIEVHKSEHRSGWLWVRLVFLCFSYKW